MNNGPIHRRSFLALLGGAAAAWPLGAEAQQPAMPEIGWFVNTQTRASDTSMMWFHQGLRSAGFIDGINVATVPVFANNQLDRLPALAADLVRRRVAVIVRNNVGYPNRESRHVDHTNCLHQWRRPGRSWLGDQHQPAGRQRHWY